MRAQQDKTAGGCALIRVERCALIFAPPTGGVRAYQGGTFRGTKPAVSLSSARRPVVEIIKFLLRPAKAGEVEDERAGHMNPWRISKNPMPYFRVAPLPLKVP